MPYPRSKPLFPERDDTPRNTPAHYLIAHSDGGARGNPGPAGYGVVIQDQSGKKVAHLSEYLGHQTNNFAEYQGLIAALEYVVKHGPKALKVISDSELLVRQIKGIYKVKNPKLKDLHARTPGATTTRKPPASPTKPWTKGWAVKPSRTRRKTQPRQSSGDLAVSV